MLKPTKKAITSFVEVVASKRGCHLEDVRMDIPNSKTVILSARAIGPMDAKMWMKAFISTDEECILSKDIARPVIHGDLIWMTIKLTSNAIPRVASILIESTVNHVEHLMGYEFKPEDIETQA